jgi:hypothetical protein
MTRGDRAAAADRRAPGAVLALALLAPRPAYAEVQVLHGLLQICCPGASSVPFAEGDGAVPRRESMRCSARRPAAPEAPAGLSGRRPERPRSRPDHHGAGEQDHAEMVAPAIRIPAARPKVMHQAEFSLARTRSASGWLSWSKICRASVQAWRSAPTSPQPRTASPRELSVSASLSWSAWSR